MKSTILTISLLMAFMSSKAQFTLRMSNKFASGSAAENEIICKGYLKNTGSSTAIFVWRLDKSLVVNGWGSTICDKNTCYDTSVYSAAFDLAPGDSGILNVYVFPFLNGGYGSVGITVYKQGDSANGVKDTVHFNAWTLSIEDRPQNETRLYPVPATNQLFIDLDAPSPLEMIVFNTIGQQQLRFTHYEKVSVVNIDKLLPGVYYLSYVDKNGVLNVRQFLKQ